MKQYIRNIPGYIILAGLFLLIGVCVFIQQFYFKTVNPWAKKSDYTCYEISGGITNDEYSGDERYLAKAENGDAYAQMIVGNFYRYRYQRPPDEHGQKKLVGHRIALGTPAPDYAEAIKWYKRAAAQGDTIGQFKLADMYLNGYGVDRDSKEAYFWASLVTESSMKHHAELESKNFPNKAVKNNPRCSYDELRREALQNLTASETDEVEKRIKEWKPILEKQQ